MKKIVVFILLMFLTCNHLFSKPELNGFKLGYNYNQIKAPNMPFHDSNHGFILGMSFIMPFHSRFDLQPEVLFAQKGFSFHKSKIVIEYLELPVLLKYKTRPFNILAGPVFDLRTHTSSMKSSELPMECNTLELRSDYYNTLESITDYNNKNICLAAGIEFSGFINSRKFNIEIRYNKGLTNIAKNKNIKQFTNSVSFIFQMGVKAEYKPDAEIDRVDILKQSLLKRTRFIMTSKQVRQLKKLNTISGINSFIDKFWQEKDTSPDTPANEFKKEYFSRMQIVDSLFNENKWDNNKEKIRVLLLYGAPDEIYRYPIAEMGINDWMKTKSLDIWLYYKASGNNIVPNIFTHLYPNQMKFIFADITGLGTYSLLFSTEEGEAVDPRLYQIGDQGRQ